MTTYLALPVDLLNVVVPRGEVPGPRVVGPHIEVLLLGKLHLDGAGVAEDVAAVEAVPGLYSGREVTKLNQRVDHRAPFEHDDLVYLTCLATHLLDGVHIKPVDGVEDRQ